MWTAKTNNRGKKKKEGFMSVYGAVKSYAIRVDKGDVGEGWSAKKRNVLYIIIRQHRRVGWRAITIITITIIKNDETRFAPGDKYEILCRMKNKLIHYREAKTRRQVMRYVAGVRRRRRRWRDIAISLRIREKNNIVVIT